MASLTRDHGAVRDEVNDTDMTAADFRAAMERGVPAEVVTSREEFEARTRQLAGTFEVYRDRAGSFRFRLMAQDGRVVATSEAYESRAAARKGAELAQSSAYSAPIVEAAS